MFSSISNVKLKKFVWVIKLNETNFYDFNFGALGIEIFLIEFCVLELR